MQPAISYFTREDYLQLEEHTDSKHEFYQGEVFAMAGGSFHHATLKVNLMVMLANQLRGKKPCRPMNSDMRIHTPSGLDTYPDISIYCNQPELTDNQRTLLNPIVIIEVLSPTTRNYDRSEKFWHYRTIPTLQDYLLVDSEKVFVEHFHQTGMGWLLHDYTQRDEVVMLPSLEETLALSAIYDTIDFNV